MTFVQNYKNNSIIPFTYPIDTSFSYKESISLDNMSIQENIKSAYNIDNINNINLNDFHNINFNNKAHLTDIGVLSNNNKNSIKNEIQQFYDIEENYDFDELIENNFNNNDDLYESFTLKVKVKEQFNIRNFELPQPPRKGGIKVPNGKGGYDIDYPGVGVRRSKYFKWHGSNVIRKNNGDFDLPSGETIKFDDLPFDVKNSVDFSPPDDLGRLPDTSASRNSLPTSSKPPDASDSISPPDTLSKPPDAPESVFLGTGITSSKTLDVTSSITLDVTSPKTLDVTSPKTLDVTSPKTSDVTSPKTLDGITPSKTLDDIDAELPGVDPNIKADIKKQEDIMNKYDANLKVVEIKTGIKNNPDIYGGAPWNLKRGKDGKIADADIDDMFKTLSEKAGDVKARSYLSRAWDMCKQNPKNCGYLTVTVVGGTVLGIYLKAKNNYEKCKKMEKLAKENGIKCDNLKCEDEGKEYNEEFIDECRKLIDNNTTKKSSPNNVKNIGNDNMLLKCGSPPKGEKESCGIKGLLSENCNTCKNYVMAIDKTKATNCSMTFTKSMSETLEELNIAGIYPGPKWTMNPDTKELTGEKWTGGKLWEKNDNNVKLFEKYILNKEKCWETIAIITEETDPDTREQTQTISRPSNCSSKCNEIYNAVFPPTLGEDKTDFASLILKKFGKELTTIISIIIVLISIVLISDFSFGDSIPPQYARQQMAPQYAYY